MIKGLKNYMTQKRTCAVGLEYVVVVAIVLVMIIVAFGPVKDAFSAKMQEIADNISKAGK